MPSFRSAHLAFACIVLSLGVASHAAPARWPDACANALTRVLPGWRHAIPPPDALPWARNNRLNPTVTRGDFDADRRSDWAALVNAPDGSAKVAVCFSSKGRRLPPRLMLIDEPYCSDVLYLARAGSVHENFETRIDERIARDGISVSCFEKAGATYLYERGRWRFIVDSD